MKSIFIISSYPSTPKKIEILKQCLKSTKDMGFDVCLTTNYKIVDPEIYDLVDYIIWDKTDIQSMADYGIFPGPGWFLNGMNFRATLAFDNAYHFDLYRSLRNGVNLAKGLGYDFFYYLEGDRVIIDKKSMISYRDKMFESGKKMIFAEARVKSDGSGEEYVSYMTHLFGGIPSDFLESTKKIPYDIEKWASDSAFYHHSMEIIFYLNIPNKEDIYFVDYEVLHNLLEANKSRKVDDYGFKLMFFFNGDEMHFLIHNNSNDKISRNDVYIDDSIWISHSLGPRCYYIQKVDPNFVLNKKVKNVVTVENDVTEFEILMNEKKIETLKRSQKINFI